LRVVEVPFIKAHGLCNDYVLVDHAALPDDDLATLARRICDRRTGVGADGLLVIGDGSGGAASFCIVNADGSEAELCGNGLRCAAAYHAGGGEASTIIESALGQHHAEVTRSSGGGWMVTMDLVPAEFEDDVPLVVDGVPRTLRVIRIGNPHAVLMVDGPPADGLVSRVYAACEAHERFRGGINVHVAWFDGADHLQMRSWERGVGLVLACGTGAAAVAASLGDGPRRCSVHMPGGTLYIEVPPGHAAIRMEGPVVPVCEGVYRYAEDQP